MKPIIKTYAVEIKKWLDNPKKKSLKWDNMCPDWLLKATESIKGVSMEEEFETNGWQLDYFQYFTYKDKKYIILGSAFYGRASIEESE